MPLLLRLFVVHRPAAETVRAKSGFSRTILWASMSRWSRRSHGSGTATFACAVTRMDFLVARRAASIDPFCVRNRGHTRILPSSKGIGIRGLPRSNAASEWFDRLTNMDHSIFS